MNILLLGHKGYLGSYLHKNLSCKHDIAPTQSQYDYIINCIGKPSVEYCEDNQEISYVSNYSVIIPYVKSYPGAKVIGFSSYYVYDDGGLCHEMSNVTDLYAYTRHKLLCEKFISDNNGVIFRLGKLFGNLDFINRGKLTEYIINNDDVVLDLVKFNPVSVRQVLSIVEFELACEGLVGVYNASNAGYTSSYDYGLTINSMLGSTKTIKSVEKMPRIFHNYGKFLMSVEKLQGVMRLTDWREDMEEYLEELKCIV
jgi:dTDP-4-dehydrorhamnose reductase